MKFAHTAEEDTADAAIVPTITTESGDLVGTSPPEPELNIFDEVAAWEVLSPETLAWLSQFYPDPAHTITVNEVGGLTYTDATYMRWEVPEHMAGTLHIAHDSNTDSDSETVVSSTEEDPAPSTPVSSPAAGTSAGGPFNSFFLTPAGTIVSTTGRPLRPETDPDWEERKAAHEAKRQRRSTDSP